MAPRKKVVEKKRKKRTNYSEESVQLAVKSVKENGKSQIGAARLFGVPRTTLQDRLNGSQAMSTIQRTVLTKFEEEGLVSWMRDSAERGMKRTREEVIEVVHAMVSADGRQTPFRDGKPGEKWFKLFFERHSAITAQTSLCSSLPSIAMSSSTDTPSTSTTSDPSTSSMPDPPKPCPADLSSPTPTPASPSTLAPTLVSHSTSTRLSRSIRKKPGLLTSSQLARAPSTPSSPINSDPSQHVLSAPSPPAISNSTPSSPSASIMLAPPTFTHGGLLSTDLQTLLLLVANKGYDSLTRRIALHATNTLSQDPEDRLFISLYDRLHSELSRRADGRLPSTETIQPEVSDAALHTPTRIKKEVDD